MKVLHIKKVLSGALLASIVILSASVQAGVTPEEAGKLKSELTPFGAEKAGNKDGTIPAWDGGYTKVPAGYQSGQPRPDPYASDKPLYSITSKNMDQYADKLAEGQKALLKKYSTYRIDVYPTRRTAAAPQWVNENTFKNATRTKTPNNGGTVEGAYGGIPFPIPKTGSEVMWNHVLRWRGEANLMPFRSYVIGADGKMVLASEGVNEANLPFHFKDGTPENNSGEFWTFYQYTKAPSFKSGESLLLRDQMNVEHGRQAWQYLVGQRRVRRFPTLGYDTPNPVNSGADMVDQAFVFNGFQDKFNWKLIGKKEMLIPYNMNRFFLQKDAAVIGPKHLNPDHVRWELHRVWVVEAALASGKRHVEPKRVYYFDEDTWIATMSDGYDSQGQLWHTLMNFPWIVYELPGVLAEQFAAYDFIKGSYSALTFGEMPVQYKQVPRYPASNFTPEAMAGRGVR
jgi:hypothetical protein